MHVKLYKSIGTIYIQKHVHGGGALTTESAWYPKKGGGATILKDPPELSWGEAVINHLIFL